VVFLRPVVAQVLEPSCRPSATTRRVDDEVRGEFPLGSAVPVYDPGADDASSIRGADETGR
jgi:hypothetical protein